MEHGLSSTDKYINQFPEETRSRLNQIRSTIQKLVPNSTEVISYGMPTFKLNGNLVHFAGYKNHIGFYPGPAALLNFENEIAKYKHSKGAVQFPLDQELPLELIEQITRFCVKELR